MFSASDAKQLRHEFWISFGKSFPRDWILYKTKVKGLSFNPLIQKWKQTDDLSVNYILVVQKS